MSAGEKESSKGEVPENHGGLILGCWDHEKTATLIQDLEHSVNLVERKCIQLFEELIYYKKYLEESGGEDFRLAVSKSKARKSRNSNFFSGSEPDIAFRKNLINFQKVQQVFEEKFKAKLCYINEELREAARKIGLKDNIILLRTGDHTRSEEAEKFCSLTDENYGTFLKTKTKSDPIIFEHGEEAEFSKITKDELEIYQKLSRLSIKRRKKKKKLKGRKMKFRFTRKSSGCRQGFRTCKAESKRSKFRKNKLRERKNRAAVLRTKSHLSCDSSSKINSQGSEIEEMCKSLNESFGVKNFHRSGDASKGQEVAVEGNQSLGAVIRKTVPFTACTSTSRSHNIGLNIQQLLSLSKHGRNFVSEKRKVRSKYTGSSPEGVFQYHKSTTRQYTNGRKSVIKCESKTAYAVGSNIMVSNCQRTDVFRIGRRDGHFENASGDGTCNGGCVKSRVEGTKVYGAFLSMCRKYSSLKEKLIGYNLTPADKELKSLESEIDCSIEKYKDFLQFYSKFLQLNHHLKSLKIACESKMFGTVVPFSSNSYRKMCCRRPTHSSTMKKALREVQTLQEKIRLVNV